MRIDALGRWSTEYLRRTNPSIYFLSIDEMLPQFSQNLL